MDDEWRTTDPMLKQLRDLIEFVSAAADIPQAAELGRVWETFDDWLCSGVELPEDWK